MDVKLDSILGVVREKDTGEGGSGGSGGVTPAQMASALATKVDKVEGKGLSANDYTDADKAKVALAITDISGKVDKVEGKGLSANDYTDADKAKVDSIGSGGGGVGQDDVVKMVLAFS